MTDQLCIGCARPLGQLAGMLDETSRLLAGVEYAAERLANL